MEMANCGLTLVGQIEKAHGRPFAKTMHCVELSSAAKLGVPIRCHPLTPRRLQNTLAAVSNSR
jgi:hypothetical protein